MSLAKSWEEYAKADADERYETTEQMMKAAFYAGAEAWRDASENGSLTADLNAEIDHFRSHK